MGKVNLTIDGTNNTVKIEYLKDDSTTTLGTEFFKFTWILDDLTGWWFYQDPDITFNRKLWFADIVNLNGAPIGSTTQAQVTALLQAAIS